MKKINSREFQAKLLISRFPNQERDMGVLCDALRKLDPAVELDDSDPEVLRFEQFLLDTPNHAYDNAKIKLRVRTVPSWTTCTYKVTSRDLLYARCANVDATDPDAESKLEENIYPYYSGWAAQSTTRHRKPQYFPYVRDWCELFPSAAAVASKPTPLVPAPSTFFTTYSELVFDFDGERCKGTLEFKYHDAARTVLRVVELAWKHVPREGIFDPRMVRLMRRFYVQLTRSGWVDLDGALSRVKSELF